MPNTILSVKVMIDSDADEVTLRFAVDDDADLCVSDEDRTTIAKEAVNVLNHYILHTTPTT